VRGAGVERRGCLQCAAEDDSGLSVSEVIPQGSMGFDDGRITAPVERIIGMSQVDGAALGAARAAGATVLPLGHRHRVQREQSVALGTRGVLENPHHSRYRTSLPPQKDSLVRRAFPSCRRTAMQHERGKQKNAGRGARC